MKFLLDQTKLELPSIQGSACYEQTINSEIKCNTILQKQMLRRKISIKITPYDINFFEVEITTEDVELQLDSIFKKQENLSKEVFKPLDCIQFRVNQKGELINILNHKEILAKWYVIKQELQKYYKGQAIERYVIGMERKIRNHDKLLSDCKQYRLYGLLFNDMFQNVYVNDEMCAKSRIRTIENSVYQLPLTINEQIALHTEDDQEITLRITGNLHPDQPYDAKINNLFTRKNIQSTERIKLNKYNGTYIYDKETSLFQDVRLEMLTTYGQEYHKKQQYSFKRTIE